MNASNTTASLAPEIGYAVEYATIVDKLEAARPEQPAFETLQRHVPESPEFVRDRAREIETATLPQPTVEAVESAKAHAAAVVAAPADPTFVGQQTFNELKEQINDSFGEIAGILLDLQARFQQLDERIELFNKRGGHKI